jgi:hypothetical protein
MSQTNPISGKLIQSNSHLTFFSQESYLRKRKIIFVEKNESFNLLQKKIPPTQLEGHQT